MTGAHPHEFYREVARVALTVAGPHRFVLGGGVAWAAHGLVTRPTEDVDLFADVEGAAAAAAAGVRAALEAAGFEVADADPESELADLFDGFDRDMRDFVVGRDGRQIRLSLARLDRHRSPVVMMDLGPVMDVQDLIANKTAALVNRREARDYIDVAAALKHRDVTELVELARQIDPALDDEDIRAAGRYLDRIPDRRFARYGLGPGDIAGVRRRLASWPR
ncbi:nucleotidyl transferase AbiEii/AbiGii toxin family protein [Micromonospora sp. CA-263727]|uniref:nucleotidyl transferase AbiEii/AbiGii toxin family protein n=1 Tax=Micromonospora sp. CA-263727 TaxID=3239967 RepID=UPI003D8B6BDB